MNRGSCLCGAVQFEAGPFTSMEHCHCSLCRRHHGAMFATFLTTDRADFRWLAGESEVVTWRSSERGRRPFCRRCGSVAPVVLPDWPDTVFIPAGNVEGDPGIRPEFHMFASSVPAGFPITDALPQYATFPPGFDTGRTPTPDPAPPPREGFVRGACLCGAVAYELAGPPELAQNCHCSRCRRARGAAHGTNAFYRGEQLAWLSGEALVTVFPLPGAKRFGQAFCSRCGGKVARVSPVTGFAVVPYGGLDGPAGLAPRGHIFVGSKAPWYDITDGLPQWEELPA